MTTYKNDSIDIKPRNNKNIGTEFANKVKTKVKNKGSKIDLQVFFIMGV